MAEGELRFRVRGDMTDLDRGKEKLREFEGYIEGMFKRRGGLRAEFALEAALRNITQGDIPGALEAIAARFSGLGLIGGVALGTIAYGFKQIVSGAMEAVEAGEKAQNTLRMGLIPEGTAEQAQGQITRIIGNIDELTKKLENPLFKGAGFVGKMLDLPGLKQLTGTDLFATFLRQVSDVRTDKMQDLDKLLGSLVGEAAKVAELEQRTADTRETALSISRDQAAIDNVDTKTVATRYSILQQTAAMVDKLNENVRKGQLSKTDADKEVAELGKIAAARIATAERAGEAEKTELMRQMELRDLAATQEDDINKIKERGLSPEREKVAILKTQLGNLISQQGYSGDVVDEEEKRRKVIAKSIELQQTERESQLKQFKPAIEKAQLSFEELLKIPAGRTWSQGWGGFSEDLRKAQMAQREEQIGERLRLQGRMPEAAAHFERAQAIKDTIGALREAEKSPEAQFRNGLDSSSQIGRMVTLLGQIYQGITGIRPNYANI